MELPFDPKKIPYDCLKCKILLEPESYSPDDSCPVPFNRRDMQYFCLKRSNDESLLSIWRQSLSLGK